MSTGPVARPPLATGPARGKPPRLTSLEAATAAALRILDQEGLQALSMRRLADDLGVGKMTLYGYFRTKDELLDRVIEGFLLSVPMDPPDDEDWRERLITFIDRFRLALREHPGVLDVMLTRPTPSPALDRFRETVLDHLINAGFPTHRAIDALTAVICYSLGYSQYERLRSATDPSEETSRLRGLSPQQFPRLSDVADSYAGHLTPQTFLAGLRSLVNGLSQDIP